MQPEPFDSTTDEAYLAVLRMRTNILLSFGMYVCYFYALQDGKPISLILAHANNRTNAYMYITAQAQFLAKQGYQLRTVLHVPGDRRAWGHQYILSTEIIKFNPRRP
jgi:hypothetical protein